MTLKEFIIKACKEQHLVLNYRFPKEHKVITPEGVMLFEFSGQSRTCYPLLELTELFGHLPQS